MLGMIKMAEADLLRCCGATLWARAMAAHAFPNPKEVLATADSVWWSLDASAWIEAFRAHPRVGERAESKWPQEEQYATRHASHETMAELREANHRYEERFGFPFVMSASGKTADQMLKASAGAHESRTGSGATYRGRAGAADYARALEARSDTLKAAGG